MTRQSVAYSEHLDDFVGKNPYVQNGEISGIKLRESLFIVYSCNNSVSGSEFVYNLKALKGAGEMIFDTDMNSCVSNGGSENCGVYKLEDGRILDITFMKDWHFRGLFFKNEKEWVQHCEFVDRNSLVR
ncbi:MAG: hypothetical protein ACR2NC_01655 [Thermodesulfobacteriota bacterium]